MTSRCWCDQWCASLSASLSWSLCLTLVPEGFALSCPFFVAVQLIRMQSVVLNVNAAPPPLPPCHPPISVFCVLTLLVWVWV